MERLPIHRIALVSCILVVIFDGHPSLRLVVSTDGNNRYRHGLKTVLGWHAALIRHAQTLGCYGTVVANGRATFEV